MNDNGGIQKPSGLPKPLPFPLESRGPVQQHRVLRQKLGYAIVVLPNEPGEEAPPELADLLRATV